MDSLVHKITTNKKKPTEKRKVNYICKARARDIRKGRVFSYTFAKDPLTARPN